MTSCILRYKRYLNLIRSGSRPTGSGCEDVISTPHICIIWSPYLLVFPRVVIILLIVSTSVLSGFIYLINTWINTWSSK